MFRMITIDRYQETDLESVRRFIAGLQDHERELVPALKPGADIALSYADHMLGSARAKSGVVLVAHADGVAIGFICAWSEPGNDMLVSDAERAHAYVSDLYVDKPWRRSGVAGQLMQAVEVEMKARGCRRIELCAKAFNASAVSFYERSGYEPYEIIFAKNI
jgi:hypothetical protein